SAANAHNLLLRSFGPFDGVLLPTMPPIRMVRLESKWLHDSALVLRSSIGRNRRRSPSAPLAAIPLRFFKTGRRDRKHDPVIQAADFVAHRLKPVLVLIVKQHEWITR